MKERLVFLIDFSGFSLSILLLKVFLELEKKYFFLKIIIKGKSIILKILKKIYEYRYIIYI